jgi:HD-GYP domain-containing protein (c-di-GMP phosphodiesterase class II)
MLGTQKTTDVKRSQDARNRTDAAKEERFMAIPPGAIIPGTLPKFSIYVRSSKSRYVLWAEDGNRVTTERILKLAEGGHNQVFVDLEEEFKYEEYLETHLGSILEHDAPSEQKAAIFGKVSANVVKGAFEESLGMGSMGRETIERTRKMITNALIFIAESKSMEALAKMIGHDYQTYEHATKVLWFTVAFLNENRDIIELIEPSYKTLDDEGKRDVLKQCGVAALLHDIGKAFVAQQILSKNGRLIPLEWEIMKRHPLHGLAMLFETDIPDFAKRAVLQHHEDFKGGGYPMGISGPAISMLARVLRIVDVFDAMTSRRPYKEPVPPMKAVQIMIGTPAEDGGQGNGSPTHSGDLGMKGCFDEAILRKFIVFLGNVRLKV